MSECCVKHFMVWNAFPLHPHRPQDVLSVRNPKKKDVLQFSESLRLIKAHLNPTHRVAGGRVAFEAIFTAGMQGLLRERGS